MVWYFLFPEGGVMDSKGFRDFRDFQVFARLEPPPRYGGCDREQESYLLLFYVLDVFCSWAL